VNGNCAAEATSQPEKCSDYDSQTRFPMLCTVWRPERNYSRQRILVNGVEAGCWMAAQAPYLEPPLRVWLVTDLRAELIADPPPD
jgi:hypothetical protein